jgi:hypothetical protein
MTNEELLYDWYNQTNTWWESSSATQEVVDRVRDVLKSTSWFQWWIYPKTWDINSVNYYIYDTSWWVISSLDVKESIESKFIKINGKAVGIEKKKVWFLDHLKKKENASSRAVIMLIRSIISVAKQAWVQRLKLCCLAQPRRTRWKSLSQERLQKFYESFWFKRVWNSNDMILDIAE